MNNFCEIQTSKGTRCFSNGTEASGCKDYCNKEMPALIRWIKEYFDKNIDPSYYCLFIKYMFMDADANQNSSSIDKDDFDYYMKIFKELFRFEKELNGEKEKHKKKIYTDATTPLLSLKENKSKEELHIEAQIQLSLYGIPRNNIRGFSELKDILFTQYSEYLPDILHTFKESCSIVTCTKAFIDMLIWNTNKIDGLKDLIVLKNKEEVLRVVDAKLNLKIPVYIESGYYYWFLDTIISNSSDIEIINLATNYKDKTYDELVDNLRDNGILYEEFNRIIKGKLRNIKFALQGTFCTSKFNKKDYKTKLYSDVNPFVEDYYSNI